MPSLLLTVRLALMTLAASVLVACGSAPSVRSQKTFDAPAAKISRVIFFYQDMGMTTKEIYNTGNVWVSLAETGYYAFGEKLAQRTRTAFEKKGVAVIYSGVVPPGEWQPQSTKVFLELGLEKIKRAAILIVIPRSGTARATRHASQIDFVYEVRLLDGATAKLVWTGLIDTSTWKGRDFINKDIQGHKFDEAYADQFLDVIIETLRTNGLL